MNRNTPSDVDADTDAALEANPPTESVDETNDDLEPGAQFDPDPDAESESEATPCSYTDYRSGEAVEDLPATGEDATGVEAAVWDALYGVEDPEMPVSIVDLGLIYGLALEDGHATVDMTLTYSGCPARDMLQDEIRETVADVDGVESVDLRLVWSPGWTIEMVTEQGRSDLREFGLSV
ncbi:1,2-phenylacetyl-CoA epoxidase subunit PaaD [Natronosalvus halobius]|uniref:1,2-phenylacetyl-CoA epoxidase subunit PaaD n=1 Tax=Natronosalvus halobius TaxID=2953746 RepID=UPI0028806AB9|nr:1,2-phenylacetyl-CoA epoxidase subunit PaaD [Natronosalvus halobius]